MFKLKHYTSCYKISEESNSYISGRTLTDDRAILFLKEDPNRIYLFSTYPDNWRELCGFITLEPLSDDKATEIVEDSPEENAEPAPDVKSKEGSKEPCSPCKKKKELQALKMNELRAQYPDVKSKVGMTKTDYINLIVKDLFKD